MFGKRKDFTTVGFLIDGLPVPAETPITLDLQPTGITMKGLIGTESEWCMEQGISVSTYYNWQQKVFQAVMTDIKVCFAEILARRAAAEQW